MTRRAETPITRYMRQKATMCRNYSRRAADKHREGEASEWNAAARQLDIVADEIDNGFHEIEDGEAE